MLQYDGTDDLVLIIVVIITGLIVSADCRVGSKADATYLILGLLGFISFLIVCGAFLVGSTLTLVQRLPACTQDLADLAYSMISDERHEVMNMRRTKADTGVFVADILTLFIGEEHVGGKTTLGGIGICGHSVSSRNQATI